ncbi:hypothetical protein T4D_8627 [Trichinella pseudospiralis]|uniref:Uncharacterized protein n=1 Tax=Trichinella pseudospiralis TaxID=6337 RepID=A0A0V1FAS8_TRIPS|nr:hypothetical protein T4D_8627 [Trichinella pseudospiralis]
MAVSYNQFCKYCILDTTQPQILVHALKYLAIPEIKNTVTSSCRHLLYEASTKSFLNDRRFYTASSVMVEVGTKSLAVLQLNAASYAFAVQRKYTTINGTYQVSNHISTKVQNNGIQANERIVERRRDVIK